MWVTYSDRLSSLSLPGIYYTDRRSESFLISLRASVNVLGYRVGAASFTLRSFTSRWSTFLKFVNDVFPSPVNYNVHYNVLNDCFPVSVRL